MKSKARSQVLHSPAADPQDAAAHFAAKGRYETDVADVAYDLQAGLEGFTLVDVRDERAYTEAHLPGAISVPGGRLQKEQRQTLQTADTLVLYCWGPACNGATKAAARLAAEGYRVKEMLGGMEYWRKEGGTLEGALGEEAPLYWKIRYDN